MPVNETDEELMDRFLEGDAAAFDALFERHVSGVHAYLYRITGNRSAAEDLAQQTFLSVVRARDRFRRGAKVKPWLYAIATNAARDARRRVRERPTDSGELNEADMGTVEQVPQILGASLQRALNSLPPVQREAIVLHQLEGLSFKEIAAMLGQAESTVKVRAHRGYQALKALLKPALGGGES